MNRFSLIVLATGLAAGFANAAAPPEHLRGTLQSVGATSVTLQAPGGATPVALTSDTSYALATKSSLGAILPGSYIGTAATGTGPNMVALEVVIFPPAMRGDGEGHYPWDPLPDISKPGASSSSSMTNGSVSSIAIPRKSASSMTNGSVQTVSTLPGAKQISVVYHGGKQIILVPPTTPVVTISKADAAILKPGVHVFIFASSTNGKTTALHIVAGANGITPPM